MFWYNPFDPNRKLCVETEDGYTIDLIANGTNIGLDSRAPTEHELKSLPRMHFTSRFKWNPWTVQLEEVISNDFKEKYI